MYDIGGGGGNSTSKVDSIRSAPCWGWVSIVKFSKFSEARRDGICSPVKLHG
jgi:hypothetical protein